MENALNINDGWEAVVNNPDRQERIDRFHAERRERKLKKLGEKVSLFAIGAVCSGLLGLTGALTGWIAAPCFSALAALAFFNFGRYSQLRGW